MAWADSRVFRAYIGDLVQGTIENQGTTSADWVEATSIKAALFGTTPTPDNDVAAASTAFNTGVWTTGNEVIDSSGGGTDWPSGGVALGTRAVNVATADRVRLTAANTASGATADIAAAFGCLVYFDSLTTPVADQGACYNYFGGTNSVTAGTFTIVWNATSGVIEFQL
jgi:hypothetical protein